jgi:hypothetical protein
VRAQHFFDDPAEWSLKLKGDLTKLLARCSNEVNHLSFSRISGNPPAKAWLTDKILKQIEPIAREFADRASEKKLHSKVREFLKRPPQETHKWISINVAHSNVASHVVTSGFSNPSTATRIVTDLPLK